MHTDTPSGDLLEGYMAVFSPEDENISHINCKLLDKQCTFSALMGGA